jgi:hypothetical protein
MVLGDNEQTSREGWAETHLGDRSSLELVGQQDDLARAILAPYKPTVVVLLNGRPLSTDYLAENAPALLEGWYLGQETGHAVADVIFGKVNPGGKLPVTIARSVGQLPVFYNHKPTARRGYLFDTTAPLYPFGYGLSYTSFDISAPRILAPIIAANQRAQIAVDVANTGGRAGDEIVQLYIRDNEASVTRPVIELKRFQRVTFSPASVGPSRSSDARRSRAFGIRDEEGCQPNLHDLGGTEFSRPQVSDPDCHGVVAVGPPGHSCASFAAGSKGQRQGHTLPPSQDPIAKLEAEEKG